MKLKQKFINWVIIIWLIIISLSLIIRVEPNIVCDKDTYMGIFITAMGIAVTLIIGFQIINVLGIKDTLSKMQKDYQDFQDNTNNSLSEFKKLNDDFRVQMSKKEAQLEHSLIETNSHILSLRASVQEGITVLEALRIAEDHSYFSNHFDAFVKMNEALLYALDYDSPNYGFILDKMREYAKKIQTGTFTNGVILTNRGNLSFPYSDGDTNAHKTLSDFVYSEVLPIVKETENKIKGHIKFTCISHDYSVLMDKFYHRISKSVKNRFPQHNDELEDF